MTISAQFIDQIVHSVMQEMQTRAAVNAPAALKETKEDKTIGISSRVVSEKVLLAANAAGRAILLQPGAVITPSGREFIRKNNVRMTSQVGGKSLSPVVGTFIAVGTNTTLHSAASAAGWNTVSASTEFEAASVSLKNLSNGIVTCCGGEPSVVACLLNRNSAVRAAVITRATNLETLTTVMSPHVVCLESVGWSFGEVLRLLRGLSLVSGGAPKDWKEPAGATR